MTMYWLQGKDPNWPENGRIYQFKRLHIPTGKVSDGDTICKNKAEFLEKMSEWNRQTDWKYWTEDV